VTITYNFRGSGGEAYETTLERDRSQINGIYKGATLEVLYAERWPELNLPRALIGKVSETVPFIISSFATFALAIFMALGFWGRAHRSAAREQRRAAGL
jgi:hypothetical protein